MNNTGDTLGAYIYAGISPLLRLDNEGNPIYYLTDAMGSVINLADASGESIAGFEYDSFGNIRDTTGSDLAAFNQLSGDFRFQGQWLESNIDFYNFRARYYDPETGTFISRDPIDVIEQVPESSNPYQFVYNNPLIYSDPTGEFTLTELNSAKTLQDGLASLRTYAGNEIRDYLREQIGESISNMVFSTLSNFLPGVSFADDLLNLVSSSDNDIGELFEFELGDVICKHFEGLPLINNIWFTPNISADGTRLSPGLSCAKHDNIFDQPRNRQQRRLQAISGSRPDFLYSQGQNAYLIGDIKLTKTKVVEDITTNDNQWQAMSNHARKHQALPFVSYISFIETLPAQQGISKSDKQKVYKEAAEKGLILVLVNFIDS